MNVSELFELTQWIQEEIVDTQIPQKYQALQQILQQNTQQNRPQKPFEIQKNALLETLKKVPLARLTKDQIKFLENLGIAQAVGDEGITAIEDILYKNVIDIATSAQEIQKMLQQVNEGIKKSNLIFTGLHGCVFEEDYEADNEILMRVIFTGHSTMSNITDFKKWGKIWYDIGRGIAMVHNKSPEDVKIVGATKGSIIIELAVIAEIAATTSGIILAALKVAEKVLDIKKKAEEIRGLKLKNDKVSKDLEKEAENEKKDAIKEISANVIAELKLDQNTQGDKITALEKSVKDLVDFIENGGEVDFVIPEEELDEESGKETNQEYINLKSAFQEIRQLENKIHLLENKKPNK